LKNSKFNPFSRRFQDNIFSETAKAIIEGLTEEVTIGKIYLGKVVAIKEYGAFVEILPAQDGLLHISEVSDSPVKKIEDVLKVGDKVYVKVIGIDGYRRIRLSRKAALKEMPVNGSMGEIT
jgi:polyribonucleotide nucleotidyltransferase